MKCLRKGADYKRVPDEQAHDLVTKEDYQYISKEKYKGRPVTNKRSKKKT